MKVYLGIGSRISHPEFGLGVVIQVRSEMYEIIFLDHGHKQILTSYEGFDVIEAVEEERDLVSYEKVERSFLRIIRQLSDIQETVPMARKWAGGRIIFEPGDKTLAGKDIPIDAFFHKIVMVRDRLRVMEQRINASDLADDEKVNLQQYITRIYGSLTSFNVLFSEKDDYFVGDKSN